MQDTPRNRFSPDQEGDADNHQKGRDLYNRDQQRRQQNTAQHQGQDAHWDAGNHFHTGYSNQTRSHFPEDSHQRTTNADRGGSLNKHYGDREYSTYRNPNSLNYGDGRGTGSRTTQGHSAFERGNTHFAPYGDARGNYSAIQDSYGQGRDRVHAEDRISEQRRRDDSNENYYHGAYMDSRGVRTEQPLPENNPYNEYPGTRSRYKDDDYRYGSGNHTWYQEQRYTDNEGHVRDRDKGSIIDDMGEGLREAWHDVTHGVSNLWHKATPDTRHEGRYQQETRRHEGDRPRESHKYEYRSSRDQGVERGPRWSDETDSGDDSFFYGSGNNPRYY